jgi:hypothetical protein
MTETERKIRNEQVLEIANLQVAEIEAELDRLGQFEKDLDTVRGTVGKLNAENSKLRSNEDALEKSKRLVRLRDNLTAIDLEENDAQRIETDIKATRARIVSLGRATLSFIAEILWALTNARRLAAKVALEELLDFSLVGAIGDGIKAYARSVLALQPLDHFFDNPAADPDRMIASMRLLRGQFETLRQLCETEPLLAFPLPARVQPAAEPVLVAA